MYFRRFPACLRTRTLRTVPAAVIYYNLIRLYGESTLLYSCCLSQFKRHRVGEGEKFFLTPYGLEHKLRTQSGTRTESRRNYVL